MTRDWFSRAFGSAVADVRQKLVEEAWFGRAVTPRPLASLGESEKSPAERMGWERARDQPERGIER